MTKHYEVFLPLFQQHSYRWKEVGVLYLSRAIVEEEPRGVIIQFLGSRRVPTTEMGASNWPSPKSICVYGNKWDIPLCYFRGRKREGK